MLISYMNQIPKILAATTARRVVILDVVFVLEDPNVTLNYAHQLYDPNLTLNYQVDQM